MIFNPPIIQLTLRSWAMIQASVPEPLHVEFLASLFRRLLKPALSYDLFLEFYHLYFQSIPQPIATEAWGIFFSETCNLIPASETTNQPTQ